MAALGNSRGPSGPQARYPFADAVLALLVDDSRAKLLAPYFSTVAAPTGLGHGERTSGRRCGPAPLSRLSAPQDMSSKSRKHSQPQRKKARRPEDDLGQPPSASDSTHASGENPDEPSLQDFLESEIKAPEGKSPLLYASMILLLVFLLIVFLLPPGAFQNAGRTNSVVMSWEHPSAGTQSLKSTDFMQEKRRFNELMKIFFGPNTRLEDEDVARMVIQDSLALEAGITVGKQELTDTLLPIATQMGGTQAYEQFVNARFFGGVQPFEATVRRFLRLNKYQGLVQGLATLPSREKIEELWSESKETRYQLAVFKQEDFTLQAAAELAAGVDLEAWFQDELEEIDRESYRLPEKRSAETIGILLGEGSSPDEALLLEAYPLPEDWDAAAEAKRYYDRNFFARYERPEEETPEPVEGETQELPDRFYSFEEVEAQATSEARLMHGIEAWFEDVRGKLSADEAVDMAAEAERLGLDYAAGDTPLSRSEWLEEGGFQGRFLAGRLFVLPEVGDLTSSVVVGGESICVGRLTEIVVPAMPPFEEIAEQVGEDWVEKRQVEMAEAAADALVAALEADFPRTEPTAEELEFNEDALGDLILSDAAAFEASAIDMGAELLVRDWLPPGAGEEDDPNFDSVASKFMSLRSFLFNDFENGQVSDPVVDFADDHYYVVRLDDSRSMPLEKMKASTLDSFVSQSSFSSRTEFVQEGPFSIGNLRSQYGLLLPADLRPATTEEEEGEGEGEDEETAG